jgi:glycolate oxidase FAD binding subunit
MISVRSEAEVVDAVRSARETRAPFEIVAGGTRRGFGRPLEATVLDVSGLSGIIKYEPEELILTVRPGTTLTEIARVLAEKNQRLGFDPADWASLYDSTGTSTLGGAIASDACGSASVRYGRARDHLLGYRAVNGLGEGYKAGGYVVKNVTGFDLSKLMCGALGTLGVLTEVTLRVFPKPAKSATYAVKEIGAEPGLALLRKVWNSTLEPTGLAYAGGRALIRLEGSDSSLSEKHSLLDEIEGSARFREVEDGERVFQDIGAGAAFANTPDDIWLAHLPPGSAYEAIANRDRPWLADCAGARLWLAAMPGDDGKELRTCLAPLGGRAVLMRASVESRSRIEVFAPEGLALAALTRAVKAAFDPLGLFNPGRIYQAAQHI